MADILQGTDQFLINRSNSTQTVEHAELMAELQDTDLMLINRSNVTFTITGEELKDSIDSGPGSISFTPTISGNNETGDVLTANAGAITGGTAPVEYAFQWKRDTSDIDGATSKTYILVSDDVGQTISCELTVAEPDGTGGVLETAIYDQIPEQGLAIVTPTIIAPPDGAGIGGDDTYSPKTSAITSVVAVNDPWNIAFAAADSSWESVAYGDDKFVAVAYDGDSRVMYSADGIEWTKATIDTGAWRPQGITYGNGTFVAVGRSGTNNVSYSSDGITWTSADPVEDNAWESVAYGNGKFVAVSYSGSKRVMWADEDDLNTWYPVSVEESSWRSVTYGNGTFVAVASEGTRRVLFSSDGISWSRTVGTENQYWVSVTYGNGKFVAVAYSGDNRVMWADENDLNTWYPVSANEYWQAVTYGDGKFVAVGSSGDNRVGYSTDAISWTVTSAEANSWSGVTYGDNKFVAVASNGAYEVMWSTNGTGINEATLTLADANTYNSETNANMNQPISETFTAGQTVTGVKAGSDNAAGTLLADASGNTMTIEPSSGIWNISDGNVKFNTVGGSPTTFVGVQAPGNNDSDRHFVRSIDAGKTWEIVSDLSSSDFRNVYVIKKDPTTNTWLIGSQRNSSNYNYAYSRDDGLSWSKSSIGKTYDAWNAFASNPAGVWVFMSMVRGSNYIGSSSNSSFVYSLDAGSNWNVVDAMPWAEPDANSTITSAIWTGTRFVASITCDYDDGIKTCFIWSTDGIVWNPSVTEFPDNCTMYSIAQGPDGRLVACSSNDKQGTSSNFCYSDDDGLTWNTCDPDISSTLDLYIYNLSYGNGTYLAMANTRVDNGLPWFTSKDGKQFKMNGPQVPGPISSPNCSMTFGQNIFIQVYATTDNDNSLEPQESLVCTTPGASGDWIDGMEVINSITITEYGPATDDLEFVGSTPTSDPTGSINTWGDATWEVSTDSAFSAPMVGTKIITPGSNQTLLPAERGAIVLDGGTDYWARLSYNAADPALPNVTSSAVRFKTSGLPAGWVSTASAPVDGGYRAIAYGGGRFVAVSSEYEQIMYSDNGIDWSPGLLDVNDESFTDITYGNSLFVAVGSGVITYSTNGVLWTTIDSPETKGADPEKNGWYGVAYGGDRFVAVAANGTDRVMWSANGTNWFLEGGLTLSCYSVTYGLGDDGVGRFVAVSSSPDSAGNSIVHSEDGGLTWAGVASPGSVSLRSVTYGDGKFVAVADTGINRAVYSSDGISWNASQNVRDYYWQNVTYGNGKFVAVASTGTDRVMHSTDAINWKYEMPAEFNNWRAVAYGGDKYVAVCSSGVNHVMYSYTGESVSSGTYYDTTTDQAISGDSLVNRYGIDPTTDNLKRLGIAELTEQPTYAVAGYQAVGDKYQPIEDLTGEVEKLKERNQALAQYVLADAKEAIAKWQAEDESTES